MTTAEAIKMQEAIKAGLKETGKDRPYRDALIPLMKESCDMAIEALNHSEIPNSFGKDTNVTSNDTISRQAAIDTVIDELDMIDHVPQWVFDRLERRLRWLSSAQSEIIRCKDCKHWIPYDWMFSEVWQSKNIADYPEDEIGCNYCDMTMKANDFCSRGERKNDG